MPNVILELPSGRTLEMREQTVADQYHMHGSLPDITLVPDDTKAADDAAAFAEQAMLGCKMICLLSVNPKLWQDFRPVEEVLADPRQAPPGTIQFDIVGDDFIAAIEWIGKSAQAQQERAVPLVATAQAS